MPFCSVTFFLFRRKEENFRRFPKAGSYIVTGPDVEEEAPAEQVGASSLILDSSKRINDPLIHPDFVGPYYPLFRNIPNNLHHNTQIDQKGFQKRHLLNHF
jgi:hypothetical protein